MKKKTNFLTTASILLLGLSLVYIAGSIRNVTSQAQIDYNIEVAFPQLTFNQPVGITNAADGTNRLFVVGQTGVISVFENSATATEATIFLNITDRVLYGGEQGLLGLAFHPNYTQNGYFYVDYVAANPTRTVIARYTATPPTVNQADNGSELILLEINQPFTNHKGGQIAFGPDGYLYIAVGDGGSGGDPFGNGQNRSTLLGKILRIDVNALSPGQNYANPVDNPFKDNALGYAEEIYAYGFRNPWRFSFDSANGQLWVGDVGQGQREEIDVVEKGKNYGWNIMEGTLPYIGGNQTGLELPVWEYGRAEGNAVIGGYVYRGAILQGLVGKYVYGDYGSGRIWALTYSGPGTATNTLLFDSALNISSFGVDEQNELYFCAFDGKIYKITAPDFTPPTIDAPSHFPLNPLPNQAVVISVNVTDAEGIGSVILSYKSGSVFVNISMSAVGGNLFSANIPALPFQTFVEYRIIAYDGTGNFAVEDNQGFFYTYTVIPEFPSLFSWAVLLSAVFAAAFVAKKRKISF
jgi:glucose/arabinose dehydrogenase